MHCLGSFTVFKHTCHAVEAYHTIYELCSSQSVYVTRSESSIPHGLCTYLSLKAQFLMDYMHAYHNLWALILTPVCVLSQSECSIPHNLYTCHCLNALFLTVCVRITVWKLYTSRSVCMRITIYRLDTSLCVHLSQSKGAPFFTVRAYACHNIRVLCFAICM